MTKRQTGFVVVPAISLVAFIAWWVLLRNMLTDCEIGSGASNGAAIVFAAPVVLIAIALSVWTAYALLARMPQDWSLYAAVGVAAVVAAIAVVIAVALTFDPGRYDISETCPSGTPAWWPFPA
ncbi:hypothetical protein DDJ48_01640 [Mycobacteroides abscessus]|uniref:hypothetical protein n=1 Tax=Mycobacteroides abscessus TaxID=36809 RepID=UPI000D3E61D4|nr:hypothetical protein [Mycobacteroides abscessus]PVA44662.1 hypothetical protein DDJ48_01640 [Mycobacteroides abscessus]RIT93271.1 hypothetical protein D2F00_20895 [Mycobacteroides abscessus]